jgi:glutamate--cysteine ligase
VLQIENEYYSTVRPKQLLEGLEKPTLALRRRGVRYVEMRSLDVNVFYPLGVAEEQLYFLEAFLLFCLLADSPRIVGAERRAIDRNQVLVAHRGRDPALELDRDGRAVSFRDWGRELLNAMLPLIELLDGGDRKGSYAMSLASQRAKVEAPELTPSARMLQEMRANNEGFFDFAWRMSEGYRDLFARHRLQPQTREYLQRLAASSIEQQREIEAADDQSFEDFLEAYFAQ